MLHLAYLAAREHPRLNVLFPFFRQTSLQLSRCTQHPFDPPCAGICATHREGIYKLEPCRVSKDLVLEGEIAGVDGNLEFEGELKEVIELIVAQLPEDCGPAVAGPRHR